MRQRTEIRQRQKQEFNARFNSALQILQMPASELAEQIRDALDSNPLLEEYEAHDSGSSDSFDSFQESPSAAPGSDFSLPDREFWLEEPQSVRAHLLQQIRTAGLSETRRAIAQAIVESVDERGYLTESVDDIQQAVVADSKISVDDVAEALRMVQQFGPPGIAARDLTECLLLQLTASSAPASIVAHARQILSECFFLLSERMHEEIGEELSLDLDEVDAAVDLIQSLNPYPGNQFGPAAETIVPDLIARKAGERWQVELNPNILPRIRISSSYLGMIDGLGDQAGQKYLKSSLSRASSFLDNVNRRHETILRVAREIVRHQNLFLEIGEPGMQPLKISDIAQALDLHESTVSRACARKYIMTPRGTYELKRLFSVRIPNRFGSDESVQAIKHRIARLIEQEDMSTPLSDQQINEQLRRGGAELSRRTVAKYRAELGIPARGMRKRMKINQLRREVV